jgi:outer membrane protein TolC
MNTRLKMIVRYFQRSIAIAVGSVLIAASAPAQTVAPAASEHPAATVKLTLDEAVRRAVENNPDLAVVRLGTEVEAARVGESRGAYAPVFSTTLGRSGNVAPPSNFLLGDRGVDVND